MLLGVRQLPTRPYVRKVEYNLLQVNRGLGPICLGGVFSAADGLWPAPCSVVPPTESGRGTAFTALGLANVGLSLSASSPSDNSGAATRNASTSFSSRDSSSSFCLKTS